MGDIDVKVDVERADLVNKALKQGLEEGLDETGEWMFENGIDRAKDELMAGSRGVWRERVKNGFRSDKWQFNRTYYWRGQILNTVEHAGALNDGLPPGKANPSIFDLIPWVDDKIDPDSETQERAEEADISEWTPNLRGLARTYGTAEVLTTFAVKGHIENGGYEGLHFVEETEAYLEQMGKTIVKGKIEKQMNNELRKRGLQ